jgi:hypothetical protein
MLINLQVRHIYIITLTGKTDISLHLQVRQICCYIYRKDRYVVTLTGKTDMLLHLQERQIYYYTDR